MSRDSIDIGKKGSVRAGHDCLSAVVEGSSLCPFWGRERLGK
jgi:hypothetical protein